jgi:hypothetical protein
VADAVVGGTLERDAGADEAAQCVGQLGSRGIEDGGW